MTGSCASRTDVALHKTTRVPTSPISQPPAPTLVPPPARLFVQKTSLLASPATLPTLFCSPAQTLPPRPNPPPLSSPCIFWAPARNLLLETLHSTPFAHSTHRHGSPQWPRVRPPPRGPRRCPSPQEVHQGHPVGRILPGQQTRCFALPRPRLARTETQTRAVRRP